jgi:hypothetical protein
VPFRHPCPGLPPFWRGLCPKRASLSGIHGRPALVGEPRLLVGCLGFTTGGRVMANQRSTAFICISKRCPGRAIPALTLTPDSLSGSFVPGHNSMQSFHPGSEQLAAESGRSTSRRHNEAQSTEAYMYDVTFRAPRDSKHLCWRTQPRHMATRSQPLGGTKMPER